MLTRVLPPLLPGLTIYLSVYSSVLGNLRELINAAERSLGALAERDDLLTLQRQREQQRRQQHIHHSHSTPSSPRPSSPRLCSSPRPPPGPRR